MKLKPSLTYLVLGALVEYFFVHPFIMIASHAMMEPRFAHQQTLFEIVREEVVQSFGSFRGLLWGFVFTTLCGSIGYLHGKVKQNEQALREANATKDKFFSILAHDLKSPLNVVVGYLDQLLTNKDNFDEASKHQYLQNSYEASKRLYQLLEDLLEWSRMQLGKMEWEPANMDVSLVAAEIIDLPTPNADKKQITLRTNIPEQTSVYADERMVTLIIRNLVANAIKFTESGGTITVASQPVGDHEEITVADTGIGISQDNIPKLFRADFVYSTTGTAKERGTGLGLVLCKEFVEQNGGKIWVESEVGKGSQFRFTLPKTNSSRLQIQK